MNKRILILGVPNDRVITAFSSFLRKEGYKFLFIDLNFLGEYIFFEENHLIFYEEKINYSSISGIYNRIVSISPNSEDNDIYYQQLEVLNFLLDQTLTNIINSPSAASSNNSKPYQLFKAREVGFNIPNSTILANTKCHSFNIPTIYKSVGGIRSIVTDVTTNDTNREVTCPVLFQEKIFGYNLRVHIIDDSIFSLRIDAKDVDYRYTESPNKYTPIFLPEKINAMCKELMKNLDLRFSGIDFMVNRSNEYYFLEANTSPAFTHFEEYMKEKEISKSLAKALYSGE